MAAKAERGPLNLSRNKVLLFAALSLVVLKVFFWLYLHPILGHDQYSLLWEARRFLSGASLYGPQISEPNPPLIIWFSALVVSLGRLFHVTETAAFQYLVFAMIVASVVWSQSLSRGHSAFADLRVRLLLALAVLVVETPMRTLLYGQREHLLILCSLPYAIAVALDRMPMLSPLERVALGTVAALGVCFKPHQVLVVVGIELVLLVFHRSLRHLLSLELLAAVFTCLLYVGAIRIFTPQYLTTMVPILRDTYWALGSHSIGYLSLHQVPEMTCAFLIFGATFFVLNDRSDRMAVLCLVSAGLFASLAYDVQRTDWGYHLLPAICFLAMAVALLVLLRAGPLVVRYDAACRTAPSAMLTAAAVFVLCGFTYLEQRKQPDRELPLDGGAFTGLTDKDAVYVFSPGAEIFPAAYRRGLQWGSRFPCLWMLPALIQNSPGGRTLGGADLPFKAIAPERVAALSTLQQTDVAEDLDAWKPKVVLVQRCPCDFIYNDRFDMLAWFEQNARFRRSWAPYVKTYDIPGFSVYRRSQG